MPPGVTRRRVALLAAGDLAVLLAFAAVGRMNHGEPLTVGDTVSTALPFIIGECSANVLARRGIYGCSTLNPKA